MKSYYDVAADRAMIVSAGRDTFANILTGKSAGKSGDEESDRAKSVFASSEADVQAFITATGVNKETWGRFETTLSSVFGAASVTAATGKSINSADSAHSNGDDGGTAGRAGVNNEYPEADIDECRQARDIVLEQYIQDAARREKLAARSAMTSSSSSSSSSGSGSGNMAGGGGDGKDAGTDRGSAAGGSKGYGGRVDRDKERENQGYGSRSSSDNLRDASGNGREEKNDNTEVDDRRRRK